MLSEESCGNGGAAGWATFAALPVKPRIRSLRQVIIRRNNSAPVEIHARTMRRWRQNILPEMGSGGRLRCDASNTRLPGWPSQSQPSLPSCHAEVMVLACQDRGFGRGFVKRAEQPRSGGERVGVSCGVPVHAVRKPKEHLAY